MLGLGDTDGCKTDKVFVHMELVFLCGERRSKQVKEGKISKTVAACVK